MLLKECIDNRGNTKLHVVSIKAELTSHKINMCRIDSITWVNGGSRN